MKRPRTDSQHLLAKSVKPDQPTTCSSLLTRRNLLLLLGGSLAALGALQWLKNSTVSETKTTQNLSDNEPVNNESQLNFLALSILLTSHQNLHPKISADIYAALSKENSEFPQQVDALFQFAQVHQFTDPDALVNAITNKAELTPLIKVLHRIVEAWYLGVVGDEVHGTATVIAFEAALMFNPARDVMGVTSYCHAPPNYWAAHPSL